jgi:hypothetical protein
MKKLITTIAKDIKLSFNGLYFYIEFGLALIFILIMLFVVPENFQSGQSYQLILEVDEPLKTQLTKQLMDNNTSDTDENTVYIHTTKESLQNAMEKNRNTVGLIVRSEANKVKYELVLQGYESDTMKALMKTIIEGEVLAKVPGFESAVTTRVLEPNAIKLSDRANILPIYLTMNVALMGLFIIAAYIFLDKDEGVIKAFAVTPVRIWQYLASKIVIMAFMGVATSLLVCFAVVGFSINYGRLILLVLAFNFFGSALGLLISSYFDAMTKAMGALYMVIMVLMFASIAYLMPSFNPIWIKWFPSYPMLFSFRALLLPEGNVSYIYQNIGVFFILSAVLFAFANWRFKKTLTV